MKKYLIGAGALLVGVLMTISVMKKEVVDNEPSKHSRADRYIENVLSMHLKAFNFKDSNGTVGIDPWGRPYEYFVDFKNSSSKEMTITLWSKGRDSKKQLSEREVRNYKPSVSKGDDFVYSKTIKI